MENSASTRVLLNRYYDGLSNKENWHSLLSENFLLSGSVARETRGREAYKNLGFWKLVRSLRVKAMIAEGECAFALVKYDLLSPKGSPFSSDVAEFWKVKDGRLDSVAIYFDTAAFNNFLTQ